MVKKRRACIFISGTGTNLRSIIKNSRDYNFPININLIITNKKSAMGIKYAKKLGSKLLSLPISPDHTPVEIEFIAKKIINFYT